MKNSTTIILAIFILLSLGFASLHGEEEHGVSDSKSENNIKICLSLDENREECYAKLCGEESKYICAEDLLDIAVSATGPERAMKMLDEIMASPLFSIKTDGHQLAHTIGRATARYKTPPGEAFMTCPIHYNYGCQHGFFEEVLLGQPDPKKAAVSICESLPEYPSKDKFYCYHGVGHGIMLYVSYNLTEAISLCDKFDTQQGIEGCWQGVFMENVNGDSANEDGDLGFRDDDLLAPCNAIDFKYRQQCYLNHAGYLVRKANFSLKDSTNQCLRAEEHTSACLHSIGLMTTNPSWQNTLAGEFQGGFLETSVHMCKQFPKNYEGECIESAIHNLMNFDHLDLSRVSHLCLLYNKNNEKCFYIIGQITRNLVKNEQEAIEACKAVPKEYEDNCLLKKEPPLTYEETYEAPSEKNEEEIYYTPIEKSEQPKIEKKRDGFFSILKTPFVLMGRLWILIRALFELADEPAEELQQPQIEEDKKLIEISSEILTEEMDSERLLYDDEYMDEAIKKYSIRSLTKSLSRLGSKKNVDCHNRAHQLGRRSYELIGSEAFKNCGVECHSGCRHGATEAFFADKGSANLEQSIKWLCGEETTSFGMHQCIHGTGHGLMAWFDYEIHDALESCDLIETPIHRESCYSGIFMENIVGGIAQSDAGEDDYHHTEYLSEDPHYPCNILEDKYKSSCYFLQTDRMLALLGNTKQIGVECAKIPQRFQHHCFFSMGRTTSGSVLQDPVKASELCREIAEVSNQNICLSAVLSDLLWDETHIDRSVFFCSLDHHDTFTEQCYLKLINIGSEVLSENKKEELCKKLPEKYYERCASGRASKVAELSVSQSKPSERIAKTKNAVIVYENGNYMPDKIHISTGQKVTFVNRDDVFWPASNLHPTHTAYPGSNIAKCFTSQKDKIFDACESMGEGSTYSFVFNSVGEWRYHDHINPKATGTIIVSED